MFLIETFVLYDTFWYDNAILGDTKSNEWYLSTANLSLSVESDGTGTLLSSTATSNAYSNSTSSWNRYLDASNDFCVEFDVVSKTGDFALRFLNSTSSAIYRDIPLTNRVSSNNHVKVEYSATDKKMVIDIDGNIETTPSTAIYGLMVTCGFRMINTATLKFKNFKVYPL